MASHYSNALLPETGVETNKPGGGINTSAAPVPPRVDGDTLLPREDLINGILEDQWQFVTKQTKQVIPGITGSNSQSNSV